MKPWSRCISGLFVLVMTICAAQAAEYAPLTRKERKDLKQAAFAIRVASDKKQDEQVREFAPAMIDKFKSVMLDPESQKYRVYYAEIESLYEQSVEVEDQRKWNVDINSAAGDSARIEMRDRFIKHLDSLLEKEEGAKQRKIFEREVKDFSEANNSISGYAFISQLRNVPEQYKKKLKERMEKQYDDILVQLCNTKDIKKLREFENEYPELFRADIEALVNVQVAKKRLRLLQRPSGEAYREYVEQTGDTSAVIMDKVGKRLAREIKLSPTQERFDDYLMCMKKPDKQILTLYDDFLYKNFRESLSIETASGYLEIFAEGKRAAVIRAWMRNLQNYGKSSNVTDTLSRACN